MLYSTVSLQRGRLSGWAWPIPTNSLKAEFLQQDSLRKSECCILASLEKSRHPGPQFPRKRQTLAAKGSHPIAVREMVPQSYSCKRLLSANHKNELGSGTFPWNLQPMTQPGEHLDFRLWYPEKEAEIKCQTSDLYNCE